jgi:hypothetical protein
LPAERPRQKAPRPRLRPWLIGQTVNNRLFPSVRTLLARMVCQFLSQSRPLFYRPLPLPTEGGRGLLHLLIDHYPIH